MMRIGKNQKNCWYRLYVKVMEDEWNMGLLRFVPSCEWSTDHSLAEVSDFNKEILLEAFLNIMHSSLIPITTKAKPI